MGTLKEYFDTDFTNAVKIGNEVTLHSPRCEVKVVTQTLLDFDAGVKYLSFYLPKCLEPSNVCASLLKSSRDVAQVSENAVNVQSGGWSEEWTDSAELMFSTRCYIYTENSFTEQEVINLLANAKQLGLSLVIRGVQYSEARSAVEKPFAFICHDSRDKKEVALPLAIQLQKLMCPVWYDEFSLKVGDNLRESIEKGIKECRKCVLVLTPNFLSNNGWTKVEFNSVFTRQILENSNVILPIWYRVSASDVYNYSPSLVDKVAAPWDLGVEEVASRLYKAL